MPDERPGFELRSEFARVSVSLDHDANGPRLRLVDRHSGAVRYLDPLEVECIVRMPTAALDRYLPYETGLPRESGLADESRRTQR